MLPGQLLVLLLVLRSHAATSDAEFCADDSDHTSFIVMNPEGARDGQLTSRDLMEEDHEVEREAELERVKGTSGSRDATPELPPLEPRVRDAFGCLMEGHPRRPKRTTLGSPVLMINLDSRPDRWEAVQEVLNSSGIQTIMERTSLEVKRWSATHLRNLTEVESLPESERLEILDKIEHAKPLIARRRDSTEEQKVRSFYAVLSCFLSHWRAVQYLHSTELARAAQGPGTEPPPIAYLVMEDDWSLRRDITTLLPDVVGVVMDRNWDVIRLDCWGYGGYLWKMGSPKGRLSRREGWPNQRVLRTTQASSRWGGSHAVLYRRESLGKVAEFFRDEPLRSVDDMLWTDKLQTYCVNWKIAKHFNNSGSNVSEGNFWAEDEDEEDEPEAATQLLRKADLKECEEHRSKRLRAPQ